MGQVLAADAEELVEAWCAQGLVGRVAARYGEMMFFTRDSGALRTLAQYGEWAENELTFLRRFIAPGAVVIDVGAYIGTHSLAFAQYVGRAGKVFAIEAQPPSSLLLRANLLANNVPQVVPIHAAATASSGTTGLCEIDIASAACFGSAAITAAEPVATDLAGSPRPQVTVPAIALDALPLDTCTLIKIDAEGAEHLVLDGALRLLDTLRPVVFAECNSVENGHKVVQRLSDHGYRVLMYLADAYNPDNWRSNPVDVFGGAREAALIGIPTDQLAASSISSAALRACESLFEVTTLDDLVAGLLAKPQYPHEVLAYSSAFAATRVGFWQNLAAAQEVAARAGEELIAAKEEARLAMEKARVAEAKAAPATAQGDIGRRQLMKAKEVVKQVMTTVAQTQRKLDTSRRGAELASSRLAAVEASTSWRIAAPFQTFLKYLRRSGPER